jgi:hypothetical protein
MEYERLLDVLEDECRLAGEADRFTTGRRTLAEDEAASLGTAAGAFPLLG